MSIPSPDPAKYALCAYFLSGYLKKNPNDAENFPPDQFPDGFIRYEALFHDALFHLAVMQKRPSDNVSGQWTSSLAWEMMRFTSGSWD
jgi:hypothetical protein